MAQASACDHCGYHPQLRDRNRVKMNAGTEYEYEIIHVICYNCGKEWVE